EAERGSGTERDSGWDSGRDAGAGRGAGEASGGGATAGSGDGAGAGRTLGSWGSGASTGSVIGPRIPTASTAAAQLPRKRKNPGDDLFSRKAALSVSSALESLTSVFGMGTGMASPLVSPGFCASGWLFGCVQRWP